MKKSILLLWAPALIAFNGCGAVKGLMTYGTDPSLNTVEKVHALPRMNSVGFEWKKIDDHRIHGVNIYRSDASQERKSFQRIGTVGNPYATHFVDTHVQADSTYRYRFSTFAFGKESRPSETIEVRTLPPFSAVSFVKAYRVAPSVVKLLWKPHADPSIDTYIIERSVDGSEWKFVSQVQGQLMAEYIDTFVRSGHTYSYRIIAQSYDKIRAYPSEATKITL
jgi:fibronectin type 3 domain-containing protein